MYSKSSNYGNQYKNAFTIVELIVVIVVIGILATITLVLYRNANSKADIASMQSDLTSASKLLKLFQVEGGLFPTTIDCAIPDNATNKCLKHDSGTTFTYTVDNISQPPKFVLDATRNGVTYRITEDSAPTLYVPTSQIAWKQIDAGTRLTCGITFADSKIYCWGSNSSGQLGINSLSPTQSSVPLAVDTSGALNGKTIKLVRAAENGYACAVTVDNLGFCWGINTYGMLGNNSTTSSPIPVAINTSIAMGGKVFGTSFGTGHFHSCATASDRVPYCWGSNSLGQLGNNTATTATSLVPTPVDMTGALAGKTIRLLTTGFDHTCAVTIDSLAYCWGNNIDGELGNGATGTSNVPVAVDMTGALAGKLFDYIRPGGFHTCAIASSQAYCWGYNASGQLGNGTVTESPYAVAVDNTGVLAGKTIKNIRSGVYHTCVIASDDKVYCWGENSNGQLGNNSTVDSPVPVAVDTSGVLAGKTITSISASGYHTCVITSENYAYCWGQNTYGQLGNNSTSDSLVPVPVSSF